MFYSVCIALLSFMHISPSEQTKSPLVKMPQAVVEIIAAYSFPFLLTTTTCTGQEDFHPYYATIYLDDSNEIKVQRLKKEWIPKEPLNEAIWKKETFIYRYQDTTLIGTNTNSEQLPGKTYDTLGATFHIRNHNHAKELANSFGSAMEPRTPVESYSSGCGNCAIYNDKLGLIATYAGPGIVSLYATPSRSASLIYHALNHTQ